MIGRTRRVAVLLLILLLLNIADLGFTLIASNSMFFIEANPIANIFLQHPIFLLLYKAVLLSFAFSVFWLNRKHPLTQTACWICFIAYSILTILWYYTLFEVIK